MDNKSIDLTILIPTINRHEYLARALEYYKTVGFNGCIFIGDSSTGEQLQKNMDLISNIKQLNIIHHIYPNPPHLHDGMVVREMNEEVFTKYVVQTGDDDFLIISNMQKCIDFLENNLDFVGAHGKRLGIKLRDDKPYGDLLNWAVWPKQDWTDENPIDRWLHYNRHPTSSQAWVFYANVWKKVYEKSNLVPSRYLGPEYLPCSMQAMLGKSKELDFLTLVCQVGHLHQVFNFDRLPFFDLMSLNTWPQSIQITKQTIIDTLCINSRVEQSKAIKEIVRGELWFHFAYFMGQQYHRAFKEGEKEKENRLDDCESNDIMIFTNPNQELCKDFRPIYDILLKDKSYKDEIYKQLTKIEEKENATST